MSENLYFHFMIVPTLNDHYNYRDSLVIEIMAQQYSFIVLSVRQKEQQALIIDQALSL